MAITDPTDISGCVCWLDPSSLALSDGASVTAWTDSSGNANDATIPLGDEPTYRDGSSTDQYFSEPEVAYESNTDRVSIPQPKALSAAGSWALAFRWRPTTLFSEDGAAKESHFIINEDSGGTPQSISLAWLPVASSNRYRLGARNSSGTFSSNTIESAVYPCQHFFLLTYDGTDYKIYIDHDWSSVVSTLNVTTEMAGSGDLYLGTHPTADEGNAFGAWGDVVLFDSIPSSADLTDLFDWYEGKWGEASGRARRLGGNGDGAHNIPTNYRTASIKINPNGTHYDMVVAEPTTDEVYWFQAPTSDPHNWTIQNGGSAIFSTTWTNRGMSHLWFGGTLFLYYEDRDSGDIYYATGTDFDDLTNQGAIFTNNGVDTYYRHPYAWERDGKVYLLLDIRTDSPAGLFGHISCTNSSDGETSWATLHQLIDATGGEDGIADDVGSPSLLVLDEGTGESLMAIVGYNEDYGTDHPGYPHSVWLATFTDPMTDTASLVADGCIFQGKAGSGELDCYAQNSVEFYDRRDIDGTVDYYMDAQRNGSVVELVVYRDLVLGGQYSDIFSSTIFGGSVIA